LSAPIGIALAVTLGCSVDRDGLGGAGDAMPMLVGSGGAGIGNRGTGGALTGTGGSAIGTGGGVFAGTGGDVFAGTGGSGTGGALTGSGGRGTGGTIAGTGGSGTGGAFIGTGGAPGTGGALIGSGGAPGTGGAFIGTGGAFVGTGGAPGTGGALAGTGGEHHGTGGSGAGGNGPPVATGCADGTREAFADEARFPSIAGCSGGWSVPGLVTTPSMTPACGRAAGNDGRNANGSGCTVEDLCAEGWHVCHGAAELTALNVTCGGDGIAPMTGTTGALFFATRQRGMAPMGCSPDATTGSNNLHGCGNFGRDEDMGCSPPLDRQIEGSVCNANPPWTCSVSSAVSSEATVVTKSGSAAGGVLCCK
jgi:hypothetical protein